MSLNYNYWYSSNIGGGGIRDSVPQVQILGTYPLYLIGIDARSNIPRVAS